MTTQLAALLLLLPSLALAQAVIPPSSSGGGTADADDGYVLGNFGVGTASPGQKFHLNGGNFLFDGPGETGMLFKRSGTFAGRVDPIFDIGRIVSDGTVPKWRWIYSDGATSEAEVMSINASGHMLGAQALGAKFGSTFGGNFFGMRLPANDNTVYFHTGTNGGGEFRWQDAGGNQWLQLGPQALIIGTAGSPLLKLQLQYASTAGTPGAGTISRAAGRAAIASGASSAVITNTVVTDAADIVHCQLETASAGVAAVLCTAGSGTFTATSVDGAGAPTVTSAAATFSFVVTGTE